tara:strand:+ start:214 stop:504 length:291 start_codon:yes stop_codon:yes gene_type:complete
MCHTRRDVVNETKYIVWVSKHHCTATTLHKTYIEDISLVHTPNAILSMPLHRFHEQRRYAFERVTHFGTFFVGLALTFLEALSRTAKRYQQIVIHL